MRRYSRLMLVALALFSSSMAWPQEPARIPASEALRHLLKSAKPEYPSLAEMAHIQGRIILTIMISPEGKVTDAQAVAGHPMLIEPALKAVRQWKYQPFVVDGTAVPVRTFVHFLFTSGPEATLREKYLLQEIECGDLSQAGRFDEAGAACNGALETAKGLSSNAFSFKTNAYGNAGKAALHLNRSSEAILDFQERLKLGKNDPWSEPSAGFDSHHNLALAFQSAGQMNQAESEYRETEKALDAESKSLNQTYSKELLPQKRAELKSRRDRTLQEHAALLRQMGRKTDADDLEQKAKSLAPSN